MPPECEELFWVKVRMNNSSVWNQAIPKETHLEHEYHSELEDEHEIVIDIYRINGQNFSVLLPELLKTALAKEKADRRGAESKAQQMSLHLDEAKAEAEQLAAELNTQKASREAAEMEKSQLSALICAGSNQAAQRNCRLTRSAVRIQSKWRQVLVQGRYQRQRAQRDWQSKQLKLVAAITSLQRLWRLKQKRRELRWLPVGMVCRPRISMVVIYCTMLSIAGSCPS